MNKKIEQSLRSIGQNNISGARELADQAAELFFDLLRSGKKTAQAKLLQEVADISKRLLAMQPTIGPLYNLTNGLLLLLETPKPDFDLMEAGKEWLALFRRNLFRHVESLRRHVVDLLPAKCSVATYSYSSTVVESLIAAKRQGKSIQVFCTEARPNLEGRRLAIELSKAGLSIRFGVDAALFGWLNQADFFLVGGDAISRRGLFNKIGTESLVRSAKRQAVKTFALADTWKLIPSPFAHLLRISPHNPEEVLATKHVSIHVENFYFDLTPLKLFDAVITEEGVLDPQLLLARADQQNIAKSLEALVEKPSKQTKKNDSPKKKFVGETL